MKRQSPSAGLWNANDDMERAARQVHVAALAPYADVIRELYEAVVEIPSLPSDEHHANHVRTAAVFLKRTLVDLRATWLLSIAGHTTSAGAVAASLVEHALAAQLFALGPDQEQQVSESQDGDLPWGVKRLAELVVQADIVRDTISKEQASARSRNIYAAYKWLCKIKHPTLRASRHAIGAATDSRGAFVVMAAPDVRPEDLPTKRVLLQIVMGRTIQAAKALMAGLKMDPADQTVSSLHRRLAQVEENLLALVQHNPDPLPFGLTRKEGERF